MKIDKSREYWINLAKNEPDVPITAGYYPAVSASRIGKIFLALRSKFAWLWRIGLIKRTTAFRWEMDRLLGEWSK